MAAHLLSLRNALAVIIYGDPDRMIPDETVTSAEGALIYFRPWLEGDQEQLLELTMSKYSRWYDSVKHFFGAKPVLFDAVLDALAEGRARRNERQLLDDAEVMLLAAIRFDELPVTGYRHPDENWQRVPIRHIQTDAALRLVLTGDFDATPDYLIVGDARGNETHWFDPRVRADILTRLFPEPLYPRPGAVNDGELPREALTPASKDTIKEEIRKAYEVAEARGDTAPDKQTVARQEQNSLRAQGRSSSLDQIGKVADESFKDYRRPRGRPRNQ
jgi:hypothetical protein